MKIMLTKDEVVKRVLSRPQTAAKFRDALATGEIPPVELVMAQWFVPRAARVLSTIRFVDGVVILQDLPRFQEMAAREDSDSLYFLPPGCINDQFAVPISFWERVRRAYATFQIRIEERQ
jgi:hypothetical protein